MEMVLDKYNVTFADVLLKNTYADDLCQHIKSINYVLDHHILQSLACLTSMPGIQSCTFYDPLLPDG